MNETLMILILLAGPGEKDLGDLLGQSFQQRATEEQAISVLVGQEAHTLLKTDYAVTAADIAASHPIGKQLTAHATNVMLIRLEGREMAGDVIVDAELWFDGNYERMTSIAGGGADPVPGLIQSLMPLVGHRLPTPAQTETQPTAKRDVTALVERQAWTDVLAALAEQKEMAVRDHYYRVLAYARLGQRDAAVMAINAMRKEFGQHFLVAAADGLIPPVAPKEDDSDIDSWTGNRLVDEAAEGDDKPEVEPAVEEEAEGSVVK